MLTLAVMDVAGTTVDMTEPVPDAFVRAFAGQGLTLSTDLIRSVRGISKREAVATLLEKSTGRARPDLVREILDTFRNSLLEACRCQPIVPLPGAVDAIEALEAAGLCVWLNTGFDRELGRLVVERSGLLELVGGVATDDDVSRGRPEPDLIRRAMAAVGVEDARTVVAVGDTAADLEAAAAAGVGCSVGVLTGAHDRERLERHPHDILLAGVSELPGALRRLGLIPAP